MRARVSHPKTPSTRDPRRCGCVAFKRFAKMSPLVVRARVGSLWCQKCGRLLCEAHRNQHSCEMEMEELERRRRVDVDAIREGNQATGGGEGAARRRRRRAQAGRGRGQGGAPPHVEGPAATRRMVPGVLLTSEHRVDGVEFGAAHAPGGHLVERGEHGPALERPGRRGPQARPAARHLHVVQPHQPAALERVSQPEIFERRRTWTRGAALPQLRRRLRRWIGMVILVEGVELDLRLPWLRDEDRSTRLDVPVEDNEDPPAQYIKS